MYLGNLVIPPDFKLYENKEFKADFNETEGFLLYVGLFRINITFI